MKHNNEPAFGGTHQEEPEITLFSSGLTKREWFAGMALSGTLARIGGMHFLDKETTTESLTKEMFQIADSMIDSSKK